MKEPCELVIQLDLANPHAMAWKALITELLAQQGAKPWIRMVAAHQITPGEPSWVEEIVKSKAFKVVQLNETEPN